VSAFTPPKASETFSDREQHVAVGRAAAAGSARRWRPAKPCALMRPSPSSLRGRGTDALHVADLHARGDDALAAVLEGHFGADIGLLEPS
jgi:hypothetical protein